MPLRTTQDYTPPLICPQVKCIVNEVIINEMRNNHLTVKISAHHSSARNSSKMEQEGKYRQATNVLVDMHNYK